MKRIFDFSVALSALVLLLPLLALTAALIVLASSGPILYAQTRVGRHGRLFRIYKFRSMVQNAERLGSSVTSANDPRITSLGRFLRSTKIDELPQLWNVVLGDMSLVGPRPDVPEIVATYTPEMRQVLAVRPGVTGIASLLLRNEDSLLRLAHDPDAAYVKVLLPIKVELAMEHVRRQSFVYDLTILLRTLWALTLGRLSVSNQHPVIRELVERITQMEQENYKSCVSLDAVVR